MTSDVLERLLDEAVMLHDGVVIFQERLEDLQDRYRLLEVRGVSLADSGRLPADCIDVRGTSAGVQCLLTRFDEVATPAALEAAFPGAVVHVGRPALREAFVAHARAARGGPRTRGAA
jgi:hypothetical protein